jgi:multidrug transporter EmrE-like cation transporter
MPTSALLLALTAAFVHALWNVLIARARDPRAATAVALLVAEVVFAVPAALAWRLDSAVWPYVVASGALQLAYFVLLVTAYRVAPLSVVYPVSRGVAPVLVLLLGVAAFGHSTSIGQVLGVCLVATGILLVRGLRPTAGRGVAFGLVIACVIATTRSSTSGESPAPARCPTWRSRCSHRHCSTRRGSRGRPDCGRCGPSCAFRRLSRGLPRSGPIASCCSPCSGRLPRPSPPFARPASS